MTVFGQAQCLEVEVIDNLEFGYSFDYSYTNTTFHYNGGSHEVILKYRIPDFQKNFSKKLDNM